MHPAPSEPDEPKKAQDSSNIRKKILHFSYSANDLVGQGYSSKVYKGQNQNNGKQVAIKVIDMNKMTDNVLREMLAQEIESLQLLKSCEQILHLEEAISTVNNTYIITELCPDGDLSDVIATGCLQEHEAAQIMQQVIKGYMQIYKNGIVHRDLKPSNVFLQGYNCKIADFGFSAKAARLSEPCNYNVGSPLYMAPEALLRNYYSYQSDIWSLGIIYYELLFGRTPWLAKSQKQLAHTIKKNSILTLIPSRITRTSLSFLLSTLNPDIKQRMTPDQLESFEFNLNPVMRYAKFKRSIEDERARQMQNYNIVRGMLPPRYNPRPLDPAYNVPQQMPNHVQNSPDKVYFTYQQPAQPPRNPPRNQYRQSQASDPPNFPAPSDNTIKNANQQQEQIHFQAQPNKFKDSQTGIMGRQQQGRASTVEEEQTTHALISEIHFCRFISKVIVKITDKENQLRRALLGVIYYKLGQLISCTDNNTYGIPFIQRYRQTADFRKVVQIAKQYQTKYSQTLGVPAFAESITYEGIMQMLKTQIKKGYRQIQKNANKDNIELLDYEVTTYQLIGLMLQTTLREFSYRSNIEAIANKAGNINSTDPSYLIKLEQKLAFLGLI